MCASALAARSKTALLLQGGLDRKGRSRRGLGCPCASIGESWMLGVSFAFLSPIGGENDCNLTSVQQVTKSEPVVRPRRGACLLYRCGSREGEMVNSEGRNHILFARAMAEGVGKNSTGDFGRVTSYGGRLRKLHLIHGLSGLNHERETHAGECASCDTR